MRHSSLQATRRARSCATGSRRGFSSRSGVPLDASKRLTAARRKLLDGQSAPAELASCEQQLAAVLHSLGRDRDVVTLLVSARELFTKADQLRDAGVCDNDLGVLRAKAGDLDAALDHFADARACFANSAADLASVAFNESLVLWEQHRSNEAMERVREARAGVRRGRGRAPCCVV